MKKLIIKISAFCALILAFSFCIVLIAKVSANKIDWTLPKEKHILFMGASHFQRAINDSIMRSAINLARSSERYMYTYLKLQNIIANNSQVDTVFLMLASTDLFENADDKYFKDNEMAFYFANFYPLFNLEQWRMYSKKFPTAFGLLFRTTFLKYVKGLNYKFFIDGFDTTTDVMNLDSVYYKPVKGSYGNKINYDYLRRIITFCNDKGIKLFFIYCPVYKPEYYYDQEYYYNAYKQNFSDIELFDYSHYPIPEDGFVDAHHLNYKGAMIFTNELKRQFGL
jgi:hypothetical protein